MAYFNAAMHDGISYPITPHSFFLPQVWNLIQRSWHQDLQYLQNVVFSKTINECAHSALRLTSSNWWWRLQAVYVSSVCPFSDVRRVLGTDLQIILYSSLHSNFLTRRLDPEVGDFLSVTVDDGHPVDLLFLVLLLLDLCLLLLGHFLPLLSLLLEVHGHLLEVALLQVRDHLALFRRHHLQS